MKLTNFPKSPQLRYFNFIAELDFWKKLTENIECNEDWQNYLLAPADIVQHLQEENDFQITDGSLNDARLRNVLDSVYKNVLR